MGNVLACITIIVCSTYYVVIMLCLIMRHSMTHFYIIKITFVKKVPKQNCIYEAQIPDVMLCMCKHLLWCTYFLFLNRHCVFFCNLITLVH